MINLNPEDYKELDSKDTFFFNKKDFEKIQGAINLEEKNKLDNMIAPLNDENEIKQKRLDAINAFQYFDKDKNGLISATDFKEILSLIGQVNNDDINEFLGRAVAEGNGYINYVEFVNFLIK